MMMVHDLNNWPLGLQVGIPHLLKYQIFINKDSLWATAKFLSNTAFQNEARKNISKISNN